MHLLLLHGAAFLVFTAEETHRTVSCIVNHSYDATQPSFLLKYNNLPTAYRYQPSKFDFVMIHAFFCGKLTKNFEKHIFKKW